MGFWDQAKESLAKAFAVNDGLAEMSPEDLALIERLAGIIVKRRMASPAVIFLEGMKPLSFIGSQAMSFAAPFAKMVFTKTEEYDRVQVLMGRREAVSVLIRKIIELDNLPQGSDQSSNTKQP